MKIVIISDTHGNFSWLSKAEDELKSADRIIHLGDNVSDAKKLSVKLEKEIDYVAGNGDVLSSAPSELELDVGGVKILALHGHRFGVNTDLYTLSAYARSVKANVCLYGHTHVPDVTYHYGIWFINPGSTSRPRSAVGATYATLDISPDKIMPDIVELSR